MKHEADEISILRMVVALRSSIDIPEEDKPIVYPIFFNRLKKELPARIMRNSFPPVRYYRDLYDPSNSSISDIALVLENIYYNIKPETLDYYRENTYASRSLYKRMSRRHLYSTYESALKAIYTHKTFKYIYLPHEEVHNYEKQRYYSYKEENLKV